MRGRKWIIAIQSVIILVLGCLCTIQAVVLFGLMANGFREISAIVDARVNVRECRDRLLKTEGGLDTIQDTLRMARCSSSDAAK